MKGSLEIHLLGCFRMFIDGNEIDDHIWTRRKPRQLIKLLALQRNHTMQRERVMETLWPEGEPERSANQLYKAIHAARRAFEPQRERGTDSLFLATPETRVVLTAPGTLVIDVDNFEKAIAVAKKEEDIAQSERAVGLYSGDLLPEDLYEAWTNPNREQLATMYREQVLRLALLHVKRSSFEEAIGWIEHLIGRDPLDEEAHRVLMWIHAAGGAVDKAEAAYGRCRALLRQEVGEEPDSVTRRLMENIRNATFPSLRAAQPLPVGQIAPFIAHAEPYVFQERRASAFVDPARPQLKASIAGPTREFELTLLRSLRFDDDVLEESLQQIVDRVGEMYDTPLCMINLVLEDRHYFKTWCGDLPENLARARSMPAENSICSFVVESSIPLVIEDLESTPQWREQFMHRNHGVRFYAGVPLVANDGRAFGTLCLADEKPRSISSGGLETLQLFAARAAAEFVRAGEQKQSQQLREELELTVRYSTTLTELLFTLQTLSDPEDVAETALSTICRAADLQCLALLTIRGGVAATRCVVGTLPEALKPFQTRGVIMETPQWELVTASAHRFYDASDWSSRPWLAGEEPHALGLLNVCGLGPQEPGILLAVRKGEKGWRNQEKILLESTARALGTALRRCAEMLSLEVASLTDELTGLGNRRALELLSERPAELGEDYRVLLGDLTGFKRLNDTAGHSVGDLCLRDVAEIFRTTLRPVDAQRIFRYGGDEFVIVLGAPGGGGDRVASRLEAAVRSLARRRYPGLSLGIDIGDALVPVEAHDLQEAVRLADGRMYAMKRSRSSRRRQRIAEPSLIEQA